MGEPAAAPGDAMGEAPRGDRRLGEAMRVYLEHRRAGGEERSRDGRASDGELLRRHAHLRELLEPLLAQDAAALGGLGPGSTLDDYRLIECIGRGGMGEVWEAEQLSLRRRVALKVLRGHSFASVRAVERFRREALAGARTSHPCLVAVHAVGEAQGVHYIAQELVESRRTLATLVREMRERPAIPEEHWRETATRFARIAEALELAHAAGVIHRDLKPLNILIASDGTPKVADFGLALVADEGSLSRTGDFSGSPFYMSPEQASARRGAVDARSDVFSLGATLYEALTLERPFVGDTLAQVLEKILLHDPPDPREIRSRCPRELSVICRKMLAKPPHQRFRSMREVAEDLGRFLRHEPIRAKPAGAAGRALRWSRRHPVLAASSAIVCASLLVVSVLLFETARARKAAEDSARAAGQSASAERAAAEQARVESRTSARITDFLVEAFAESAPGAARGRELSARDVLDRGVAKIRSGLTDDAEAGPRARLLAGLGRVYTRLGLRDQALDLLLESRRLAERAFGPRDPRTLEACTELAILHEESGRLAEAAALSGEVHAAYVALHGADSVAALRAESNLGSILWKVGDLDGAERRLRHAIEGSTALGERRGASLHALSEVLRLRGREAESLELARVALERLVAELGADHPDTLDVVEGLARHEILRGRVAEALALLREVAGTRLCVLGPRHASTLLAQAMAAYLDDGGGSAGRAHALRGLRATSLDALGSSDPVTAKITGFLADVLLGADHLAEAELEFAAMLASMAEGPGASPGERCGSLFVLAQVEERLGRTELAVALLEEVVGVALSGQPIDPPGLVDSAFAQAIALRETLDDHAGALRLAREDVERAGASDPDRPRREATVRRLQQELAGR